MGGYYFYYDYFPNLASDANLFWLMEYIKRNPDRQIMFEERAIEFEMSGIQRDNSCDDIHTMTFYDDNELPIISPRLIKDSALIVKQLAAGTFSPRCSPDILDPNYYAPAELVVEYGKLPYITFDDKCKSETIAHNIAKLLDYYRGIQNPVATGTLKIMSMDNEETPPEEDHYRFLSLSAVKIVLESRLKTRQRKDAPRAIGLCLWDYVQKHGGSVIGAIRTIKEQLEPEIKALGFAISEENVFRRIYRKTAECIAVCEVLPFK